MADFTIAKSIVVVVDLMNLLLTSTDCCCFPAFSIAPTIDSAVNPG